MRVSEYMYRKVLIKKKTCNCYFYFVLKKPRNKKKIKCNKATCRNILSFFIFNVYSIMQFVCN